ncbi:MAG TPA: hypothetical protein VK886_08765 [Vicinamibacterales bacterium]|nr:hypothetical protein [Vicinamibacterales bacterium]
MKKLVKIAAGALGAAAGAYAGYVAIAYARYGRGQGGPDNPLLDACMPDYEVREVHEVAVNAPAPVTMAAAREVAFADSQVVRALFRLREWPGRLRGMRVAPIQRRPVLEEVLEIGWRPLAEEPGRRLVMGAVTQPWKQNVVFRGLGSGEFAAFREPDYAKIAWTLEADASGASASVFRTETRVATTDEGARRRFRWYWSLLSPGILLIRREILRLVKTEAERRAPVPPASSPQPFV